MSQSKTGPAPKFGRVHIWKALNFIKEDEPIGRQRLAARVGIGEGSMRTVLSILAKEKLIRVKKPGAYLSAKGRRRLDTVGIAVAEVVAGKLTVGPVDAAAHVKGQASKIGKGIEQRDEAIKAGAMGATTIICKGKKLVALADVELDTDYPDVAGQLRSSFVLEPGDVIIISTAADSPTAENGAISAAFSLLGDIRF